MNLFWDFQKGILGTYSFPYSQISITTIWVGCYISSKTPQVSRLISFFGKFLKLWKVTISSVMSTCPSVRPSEWNNFASIEGIFVKLDVDYNVAGHLRLQTHAQNT